MPKKKVKVDFSDLLKIIKKLEKEMKTQRTLRFNLPEDKAEYYGATKGLDLFFAIMDYDTFLRDKIEYTEEEGSYGSAREKLWRHINDRGVDFDQIP